MKRLLILFLLIPSLSWGGWWLVSEQSVGGGGGDGFCGEQSLGDGSHDFGTYRQNSNVHSPCTATGGTVNYIYIDFSGGEIEISTHRPTIWNSSGTVLAYADSATGTNISGNLYRYTLNTEVVLTDSQSYWVGDAAGDSNFYFVTSDVAGNSYIDTTQDYSSGVWPNPPLSSDQGSSMTSYAMMVWVSNSTVDTHE